MASAALEDEVKELQTNYDAKIEAFTGREVFDLVGTKGSSASATKATKFKLHGKAIKNSEKLNSLSWADKDHLVVGVQDGHVIMFNTKAKESPYRFFYKMKSWCNVVNFNTYTAGSDKGKLAMGGLDNMITVVDVEHGKILTGEEIKDASETPMKQFMKHGGPIYSVDWLDGNSFLSGSGDQSIMLWGLDQANTVVKEPVMTFKGHTGDATALKWIDTNCFLSGSTDGTCKIFDKRLSGAYVAATFAGHARSVTKVRTIAGGNSFVSCSEDSTIRLWDVRAKAQLGCYGEMAEEDVNEASAMDVSKSGRMAFVGYEDGSINSIDLLNGETTSVGKQHTARVTAIETSPSGCAVASCSRQETEKTNFAIWA